MLHLENLSSLTFQALWIRWRWRPIRNCPGRFILLGSEHRLSLEQLMGRPCSPRRYHTAQAPDPVLVLAFQDGGLISYEKPGGRLLHTLNTAEGFVRKLQQLEIPIERASPSP